MGSEPLPIVGPPFPSEVCEAPKVDGSRLTQTFCRDLENLQSVLGDILSPETLSRLKATAETDCTQLRFADDLWARTVYEFLAAFHRGVMRRDHVTQALIPLYLGRTGSFLIQFAAADPADVEAALEALGLEFERSKPALVEGWNQAIPR